MAQQPRLSNMGCASGIVCPKAATAASGNGMRHIWEHCPTHLGSDLGLRQVCLVSLLLHHHSFSTGQPYIVHWILLLEVISREITINTKKSCEDLAANENEYERTKCSSCLQMWVHFPVTWQVNTWLGARRTTICHLSSLWNSRLMAKTKAFSKLQISPLLTNSSEFTISVLG